MDKLLAVIKREYLERVRTKWFIISTVFGPVFLFGVMILPGLLTVRGMRSAGAANFQVIDATGTGLGARVAQQVRERAMHNPLRNIPGMGGRGESAPPPPEARVIVVAADGVAAAETTATADVMASRTQGYLVLDSATIRSGKARYAGRNASSLGEMEQIEGGLRTALLTERLTAAGITGARADSLARVRTDMATERITSNGRGGSGLVSAIFGFVIAFLLYMMIILYGQNILRGVLEEKTTRVAEVVISSISPETLLAGKVIGVGAVGLTQQLIWLAFAVGLATYGLGMAASMGAVNIALPQVTVFQVVALVLYFLLGYTFYAALFAAVGAMCSSQEEATQAAQPVMMLLVASIILVQPILTTPTGTMATVMSILPFSSPIIMPMVMSATQVPAWQIAASLASLLVAVYASIWVSARIYRVGLLMTGKRPSVKELVRWVRYA
ncbi:MAG: ABC transporter permease [Gemmatimonadota bacterium]|nr:ABC transporter permease [Gemmatimonadota bacterium]